MPFDVVEFNQVTQQLKDAKELLIKEGWCREARMDNLGRRCALGVLDAIMGKYVDCRDVSVQRLAAEVVVQEANRADSIVAAYNNSQTDIKPILEWFDRAIG